LANGGFREEGIAGFPLDSEQKLVKLAAHPTFGGAVFEVAQRTFQTAQRPIQGEFWMLFHYECRSHDTKLHASAPLLTTARPGVSTLSAFGASTDNSRR